MLADDKDLKERQEELEILGEFLRAGEKVEADADRPKYVKTVRGVGYVFSGDVRRT